MKELRFVGRCGLDAHAEAARLFSLAAMTEHKYVQLRPSWNPRRPGSPEAAVVRIDEKEVLTYSQDYRFDLTLVLDCGILGLFRADAGLKNGGLVLINEVRPSTPRPPNYLSFDLDGRSEAHKIPLATAAAVAASALGQFLMISSLIGVSEVTLREGIEIIWQEVRKLRSPQ